MAKNDSIIDLELDPDLYFDEPPEAKGKKAPRGRKAPKKGKKRGHAAKARKKNKKKVSRKAWWAWPVTIVMLCALLGLGLAVVYEKYQYEDFTQMREVVARPGFCQGITIDGQDVTGRMLDDVLAQWRGEDEARRAGLDVTLVNDADTWVLNTETRAYDSDYESVIREAWTLGREGTPRERYQVIRDIQANGRAFTTTSGYDDGLLRGIVTQAAESLSTPAVEADVIDFDIETLQFTFSSEAIGTYVDADALYDLQTRQSEIAAELENPTETTDAEALNAELGQIDETIAALIAPLLEKADEIYARLDAGEDFFALMAEYGEDPGMQQDPFMTNGYYVSADSVMWEPAFRDSAMALEKEGDVSEPVLTGYGIHLILHGGELTSGPVPLDDVREAIEATALDEARQTAYSAAVEAAMAAADITVYPENVVYTSGDENAAG